MRKAPAVPPVADPPADRSTAPPVVGQTIELSFACPRCQRVCKAPWESLGQVMRCPTCRARFGIGRNGRFARVGRARRLSFKCPRCRRGGALSESVAARGVHCVACGLQLLTGPDDRLYSAEELKEARRQSLDESRARQASHGPVSTRTSLSVGAAATIACVGAIAAVLALAAWSAASSATLEATAARLTRQCLAGEWTETSTFVAEDDFQQMEFRRWRTRHFSSIRDRYRPPGDAVRIEVAPLRTDPAETVLKVTITSEFLGARGHTQCWRRHDNTTWLLDSVRTLSAPEK